MEKKTSFMSLIYREFCITKVSAAGNAVVFVMFYAICLMYTLSARFGNIAKIDEGSALYSFIELMTPMVRMMGIMVSFTMFLISAGGTEADLRNKTWALYRKSSPARPFRLAMARVVYQLIAFAVSVCLSFLYIFTDGAIGGNGISSVDIGMMSALGALMVFMGFLMTVCIEFMKSQDKGMLVALGVMFAAAAAVMIPNSTASEQMTIDGFCARLDSFAGYAPLFIAAIVIMFAAEAVLMTLLYKRRDK